MRKVQGKELMMLWTTIGAIATLLSAVFAALTYVRDIRNDRKQKKQPPDQR